MERAMGIDLTLEECVMERAMGIEPTSKAWEALVLPLNYARDELSISQSKI